MTSLEAQIKDAEKAVLDNFDFLAAEGKSSIFYFLQFLFKKFVSNLYEEF